MSGAVMHAEAWHLRLHKFDPVGTSTPQTGTSAEHGSKMLHRDCYLAGDCRFPLLIMTGMLRCTVHHTKVMAHCFAVPKMCSLYSAQADAFHMARR